MKKLMIEIINLYQSIPGPWHNHCRFYPTCSVYFKTSIKRFGTIKGSILGIKRILRCNPFNKHYGYDPVPLNYKKKGRRKR